MKFEWTEKCQHSFEQLKLKVTTSPILNITNPNKKFVLCTNARVEGLGGVLLQEKSVIDYESRKLKKHEYKYTIYDLKLAIFIHHLNMWRHYLLRKKFVLMIYHISLK